MAHLDGAALELLHHGGVLARAVELPQEVGALLGGKGRVNARQADGERGACCHPHAPHTTAAAAEGRHDSAIAEESRTKQLARLAQQRRLRAAASRGPRGREPTSPRSSEAALRRLERNERWRRKKAPTLGASCCCAAPLPQAVPCLSTLMPSLLHRRMLPPLRTRCYSCCGGN